MYIKTRFKFMAWSVLVAFNLCTFESIAQQQKPNVVLIYVDDLGYGDLSAYGATKIHTPNVDRIAQTGTRFTNAHSTSATCTPSRFALMTGIYPWRQQGTGILPGDAKLIVPTDKMTLPKVFKQAGYKTAMVGKWHLGLGTEVEKNWNADVKPGPNEVGFDYSFIFPATADRVPTVFLENHTVLGLEDDDPIKVDYKKKIGNDPTGKENPELLKMKSSPNHGHDNTIINGIGRIGYMSGGHKARWVDEEVSSTFLAVAQNFIKENKDQPFFLFFALNEPHVPRMPSTFFRGKSGLGYRGDAILQLDWTVGQILDQLELLGIADDTIVIFSSDNGPVLDDGYIDGAVTELNGHTPAGPFRGGKYSIFEGGTRIPFLISGPGVAKNKVSAALISQIDIIGSIARLLDVPVPTEALDTEALPKTLLGQDNSGRSHIVQHAGTLAIVQDNWKYIAPSNGPAVNRLTNTELGNNPEPQLYNLNVDAGEQNNLAKKYPKKVKALAALLEKEKEAKSIPAN
jgi:arylsulfatase A-like enzyme